MYTFFEYKLTDEHFCSYYTMMHPPWFPVEQGHNNSDETNWIKYLSMLTISLNLLIYLSSSATP